MHIFETLRLVSGETVPKKMYFKGIDWIYYGVRMNLLIRMYSFQENRSAPRVKGVTNRPYKPHFKSQAYIDSLINKYA